MKRLLLLLVLAAAAAHAQVSNLSDFSNFSVGAFSQADHGAWSDQTSQSGPTSFKIADLGQGTPSGELGNAFIQWIPVAQNWAAYHYVSLTGAVTASNVTPKLNFYIEDLDGNNSVLSHFDLSTFSANLSTVTVPLSFGGVDFTQVSFWGFTVDQPTSPEFGFVFDNVALSATAPIPEPATYALLVGAGIFGFALHRGRRATAIQC